MTKRKTKIMLGWCVRCDRLFIRPSPADAAVCDCHNPRTVVPLKPLGKMVITIER